MIKRTWFVVETMCVYKGWKNRLNFSCLTKQRRKTDDVLKRVLLQKRRFVI